MTDRTKTIAQMCIMLLVCAYVPSALGVDKLVTASANLSTLLTADDTVLRWTGNFTVTVDLAVDKTVAGIDAGSFTATIDFQNADRKILLGNTTGNVVIQASGGEVRIQGAGTGARTAGFLVSPSLTTETIEIRTPIDDAVNANYWNVGNKTLQLTGTTPQVGAVDIGSDGGVALLDVDQNATVDLITVQGDFTADVASGKTLTLTQAFVAGANTISVTGGGTGSGIANGAQITLDNASSLIRVSGTISIDDLDLGASAGITLLDGASLTLTDAVSIGARTLTLSGTTGSSAESITATGGFQLDNASSLLKISGDSANTLVVSGVATGTDMGAGKGIDVDQNVQFTALTVSHNMILDIASGKSVSGTATLNAAKTLILNNTGTLSSLTTSAGASVVQFTGAGTISALTNDFTGVTIDADESATISEVTLNQNADVNVATGKTLTADISVSSGRVLTASGTGTISGVSLDGATAELNMTGGGTVTTLDVNADNAVLDVDTNNCTITTCMMAAGSGDLTVENLNRTISSTGGFDVKDNTLRITQANGAIGLVVMDTDSGILDVDETTAITDLTVFANVKVQVATGKTLTTIATVESDGELDFNDIGVMTTVQLDGSGAKFTTSAIGTVNTLNVTTDGGVVDVNNTFSLTNISMIAGDGNLTLDVASGVTLVATIDVNDNRLSLIGTGVPGAITMDTSGGALDVDADSIPTSVSISADVSVDVASGRTLGGLLDIAARTLTLSGSGTVTRINASTGSIDAKGSATITDLRATFGTGGTFTFGGSGDATITTLNNSSIGTGESFAKTGTGTLTIAGGLTSLMAQAAGVHVRVEEGELVVGSGSANHDITFNDDGDDITVLDGATLTTFGSLTVSQAGDNVNLDADPGSIVNLSSTSGDRIITAAADGDYRFAGLLDIVGPGGMYMLDGAFEFGFANVGISGTSSLTNVVPSSSMRFESDSTVTLEGTGADGGGLFIDGGATTTRITMGTTTGRGAFTVDRGQSDNMQVDFVALANSIYQSTESKSAVEEVNLTGTADVGDNMNWFSRTEIEDDDTEDDGDAGELDDGAMETGDDVEEEDSVGEVTIHTGLATTVESSGTAAASARSETTGASAQVEIKDAESGSVFVSVADGNLKTDFTGITDGQALPVTMRVNSSVTGEFAAIVQLCHTPEMLSDSGLMASQLVMYTYEDPDGPWILAGGAGRYQGDTAPTFVVGDYGYESGSNCTWVVTNHFSDFAVGVGSTEAGSVGEGTTNDDASGDDASSDGSGPTTDGPVCGLMGMMSMTLTAVGFVGLRRGRRQD